MSTWCSGWNSHKTNRGHTGDFRREPFRTSCVDIEGRCGWFQNGKRVPIWKSRGGFPLCPSSCWAQTLRRHPRWAGTATKSGRRVFYLRPMGSHETVLSGCRKAISMRDRERAKFSRNKGENVEKRRSQTQEGTISPPTELCRVDELSISAMAPGDIFLIEELEAAGLNSEPTFYAILACPLCGNQALISAAQYFGYAPVICAARACPGFFRIIDEGRLVYLPVN